MEYDTEMDSRKRKRDDEDYVDEERPSKVRKKDGSSDEEDEDITEAAGENMLEEQPNYQTGQTGGYPEPQLRSTARDTPFPTKTSQNLGSEDQGEPTESEEPDEDVEPPAVRSPRQSLTPSDFSTYSSFSAYQQSKNQNLVKNALIFIVWFVVFAGLYITTTSRTVDHRRPNGFPYCDSEVAGTMLRFLQNDSDCQACPENAQCVDGIVVACAPNMDIESAICINKTDESRFAIKFIKIAQAKLSSLAGNNECGKEVEEGIFREDLKKSAWSLFLVNFQSKYSEELEGEELEDLFEKKIFKTIWKYLYKTQMNFEVDIKELIREEEVIEVFEVEEGEEPEEEVSTVEIKDWFIVSTHPTYTLACHAKFAFQRFKYYMLAGIIILIGIYVGIHIKKGKDKRYQNVADITSIILTRLKNKRGIEKSCVVQEMCEELQKIEFTEFVDIEDLWEEIVEMVEADRRIYVDANDNEEKMWVWNSTVAEDEIESPEIRRPVIVTPEKASPDLQRRLFRKSRAPEDEEEEEGGDDQEEEGEGEKEEEEDE